MNRSDVRMVERRHHARLALEPREAIGIGGKGGWQHLDGDVAAQPRVVSTIDVAHATTAEQRLDLVHAQAPADERQRFAGAARIRRR